MRAMVITGTTRGLGEALVDQVLSNPDTRALVLARDFTDRQRVDLRITTRVCDLSDPATLPDAAELADFLSGAAVGVLVNNAAVVEPVGAIGSLSTDQLARAVTVNLTAPMLLVNAFLAARPAGQAARILFVSTGAAHRVIQNWAAYSATKRGAEEFFAHLAAERAGEPDLKVAIINPGMIDTGMQETLRRSDFPERQRFVDRYEQGELRSPRVVAAEIVRAHLAE
jgi:NAD(P)-dependent dehydrogenase (short-subunit alcohol dehydrogenase family)